MNEYLLARKSALQQARVEQYMIADSGLISGFASMFKYGSLGASRHPANPGLFWNSCKRPSRITELQYDLCAYSWYAMQYQLAYTFTKCRASAVAVGGVAAFVGAGGGGDNTMLS